MYKSLLLYCSGALALLATLALIGCQTGPDGKRHYVGPNVTASIGYHGVSLSATLWSDLSAISPTKPIGPITIPETVLGIPVGTK